MPSPHRFVLVYCWIVYCWIWIKFLCTGPDQFPALTDLYLSIVELSIVEFEFNLYIPVKFLCTSPNQFPASTDLFLCIVESSLICMYLSRQILSPCRSILTWCWIEFNFYVPVLTNSESCRSLYCWIEFNLYVLVLTNSESHRSVLVHCWMEFNFYVPVPTNSQPSQICSHLLLKRVNFYVPVPTNFESRRSVVYCGIKLIFMYRFYKFRVSQISTSLFLNRVKFFLCTVPDKFRVSQICSSLVLNWV